MSVSIPTPGACNVEVTDTNVQQGSLFSSGSHMALPKWFNGGKLDASEGM
jgi:hypothetical protein